MDVWRELVSGQNGLRCGLRFKECQTDESLFDIVHFKMQIIPEGWLAVNSGAWQR